MSLRAEQLAEENHRILVRIETKLSQGFEQQGVSVGRDRTIEVAHSPAFGFTVKVANEDVSISRIKRAVAASPGYAALCEDARKRFKRELVTVRLIDNNDRVAEMEIKIV